MVVVVVVLVVVAKGSLYILVMVLIVVVAVASLRAPSAGLHGAGETAKGQSCNGSDQGSSGAGGEPSSITWGPFFYKGDWDGLVEVLVVAIVVVVSVAVVEVMVILVVVSSSGARSGTFPVKKSVASTPAVSGPMLPGPLHRQLARPLLRCLPCPRSTLCASLPPSLPPADPAAGLPTHVAPFLFL